MPANLDGGGVGSVGSVGDVGDVVEIDTTLSNQRWRMEGGRGGGIGQLLPMKMHVLLICILKLAAILFDCHRLENIPPPPPPPPPLKLESNLIVSR